MLWNSRTSPFFDPPLVLEPGFGFAKAHAQRLHAAPAAPGQGMADEEEESKEECKGLSAQRSRRLKIVRLKLQGVETVLGMTDAGFEPGLPPGWAMQHEGKKNDSATFLSPGGERFRKLADALATLPANRAPGSTSRAPSVANRLELEQPGACAAADFGRRGARRAATGCGGPRGLLERTAMPRGVAARHTLAVGPEPRLDVENNRSNLLK